MRVEYWRSAIGFLRAHSQSTAAIRGTTFLLLASLLVQEAGAAITVDFNTFVSSSNNDLVNNFTRNGTTSYTQINSGGITGGSVDITGLPDYLTQSAIFNTPFAHGVGVPNDLSIFFKYQT